MNSFYGLKRLTGNFPAVAPPMHVSLIEHQRAIMPPDGLVDDVAREFAVPLS
jgi:hypothetical protein